MAEFAWTKPSETAAQLIAAGELSDVAIAARVEKTTVTLWRWRQNPEFAARVEEHLATIRAVIRRRAIGIPERRVERLNRDWLRIQRVFDERAADPSMEKIPGGQTGLLCHTVKGVGKGDDFQLIDLYEVDTGSLRELREIEKQAAIELGQWTEKHSLEDARPAPHKIPDEDSRFVDGDERPADEGDQGADAPA